MALALYNLTRHDPGFSANKVYYCTTCKRNLPGNLMRIETTCKACTYARHYRTTKLHPEKEKQRAFTSKIRRQAKIQWRLDIWLNYTKIPYKTFSREDWLKTCAYFGGCAACGSEAIEARQLFVPFTMKGRFTPWNVLPFCVPCFKKSQKTENPFYWFSKADSKGINGLFIDVAHRDKLLNYLLAIVYKEVPEHAGEVICARIE